MKKIVKSGTGKLLATSVLAALGEKPYQYMAPLDWSWSKPVRGKVVGCRVCGLTRTTLYKDGDDRICGKCRKKVQK